MNAKPGMTIVLAIWVSVLSTGLLMGEEPTLKIPSHLSKYDLATPDDLLFSYMLAPLFESPDTTNWVVFQDLRSQIGDGVADLLAAPKIAETISTAMPIEGQPMASVEQIVADCCNILKLDLKPTVYVRNSEEQRVYSFNSSDTSFLVITSGLLNLFNKRPGELRFMVGRELGHLKADHADMRRAGLALLSLIRTVDTSVIPDKFQNALPTLALGRFLSWLRESEITADRAGLLCCQDPQVAYDAMARQLHGLSEGNSFLNPNAPDFDEDKIIRSFQQWQYQPLVKFIVHAKRFSADAPLVPDRLAALKSWVKSGRYEELLNRTAPVGNSKLLTLETIVLRNVSPAAVRPYVKVKEESGSTLLETKIGPSGSDVNWQNINVTTGSVEGKPIFFEVWESRTGYDRFVAGFFVQLRASSNEYSVRIFKDWKERSTDITPSFAKVKARVEDKVRETK